MVRLLLVVIFAVSLVLGTAGSMTPQLGPQPAFAAETAGAKVNINTAGVEELTQLNGIGEKLAQAIVAFRDANGPFATADDLLQVKGIGEKKLAAIRDRIVLE